MKKYNASIIIAAANVIAKLYTTIYQTSKLLQSFTNFWDVYLFIEEISYEWHAGIIKEITSWNGTIF